MHSLQPVLLSKPVHHLWSWMLGGGLPRLGRSQVTPCHCMFLNPIYTTLVRIGHGAEHLEARLAQLGSPKMFLATSCSSTASVRTRKVREHCPLCVLFFRKSVAKAFSPLYMLTWYWYVCLIGASWMDLQVDSCVLRTSFFISRLVCRILSETRVIRRCRLGHAKRLAVQCRFSSEAT